MSVKGDLAYQGLEDLLRADLAGQGGGRLTLRLGAHHAALHLDAAGLVVLSPDLFEPAMLLEGFAERGLIDPEVLQRVHASRDSAGRLLERLVEEGTLAEADLLETLAQEVEDTVLDLMLWEEGVYRFEQEPRRPGHRGQLARISVDPAGVVERALTRLDERRAIGDRFGDNALLFEAVAGELPPLEGPEDRIHEIYTRVDGRTVVHEMSLRMGLSRFEVLQGLARLHDAGLVRPVGPEDLGRTASDRAVEGRHAVARAIALQWAEACPEDPSPLRKLASLAVEAGDKDAEIEALCAQGNQYIQQGNHALALEMFTRAMRQAPADDVVLAGLRVAAEATGDGSALIDGTLLTAQTKLDEGDPDAALELLEPLLKSHPDNMAVHLLRARILVLGEKRSEFFEQAEFVGQALSRDGVNSETDREVAEYFRETIAHLAPDRGDLLERFRTLYDPRTRRRRMMAVTGALLLLCAAAGFYYWPASPATLLTKAQEAADAGDKDQALAMIRELVDRHPDSPEADQAVHLQARLFPPAPGSTREKDALAVLRTALEAKVEGLGHALADLPTPEARTKVQAVITPLSVQAAKPLRKELLAALVAPMTEHTERLHTAVVERVQVLGRTEGAQEHFGKDAVRLSQFIDEATRLRDPTWMSDVKASAGVLHGLAKLTSDPALVRATQQLARATQGLDEAAGFHDEHIVRTRLSLAHREFEEADRRCREDAPKLMVNGRLDQADAHYARLEALMARYAKDEIYKGLLGALERRQLPEFVRERRGQIRDIHRRLARAQEAEDAGDLDAALTIYAALVKEYWLIRFENICTLPLRVETTPPGARVLIDGEVVGTSPLVVRYAWGSETRLRVEAPGFAATELALETAADEPPSDLSLTLAPSPRWTTAAPTREGPRAVPLGERILVVDRQGVLTAVGAEDGTRAWRRDLSSLEGVRARPAVAGGQLYVARVDGTLFLLDPETGEVRGQLDLPRPRGDLATDDTHVGMATSENELIVLKDGAVHSRTPLEAVTTTGIISAHGVFWVGTADGTVLRVDPGDGTSRVIPCTRGTASIVALSASSDGMLVTTSDQGLIALAADGNTRWSRAAVGDLVAAPARCGDMVVAADRGGVLHVFAAADGASVRTIETGERPKHDLVAIGRAVLVLGAAGTLRAFDPHTGAVLMTHGTGEAPPFPAMGLAGGDVIVPFGAGRAARIRVPQPVR